MNVQIVDHVILPIGVIITGNTYNLTEEYYRELKKNLRIKRVENFPFVRIGKDNDGGYMMIDNFNKNHWGGGLRIRSVFQMMFLGIWTWLIAVMKFISTI